MPAPVRSRSAATSFAVIAMIVSVEVILRRSATEDLL
jgi:hypothetical protein